MSSTFSLRYQATAAALAILVALSVPARSQTGASADSIELLPAAGKIVGTTKIDHDGNQREVIGSWRNPSDWVKWTAKFPSPGIYDVFLSYSQADGRPGSLMELAVGTQGLQTRLEHTSNWDNPCYQYLGQVQVSQAGAVPVNLRVIEKRATWVMSLRLIRFTRSQATTLQDPPQTASQPAIP